MIFSHEIAQATVFTHVPLKSFVGFILQMLALAVNPDTPFVALLRSGLRSLESFEVQFARLIRMVLVEEHHGVQRIFLSISPVNFKRMNNQVAIPQSPLS
jgi:hypothetical protein